MSEIVSAKADNGLIEATDADGRNYQIWIDDRGIPQSGRLNTWHVPDGVNASTGHIVEIFMPVDPTRPLVLPLRVNVRHAQPQEDA